MLRRALQRKMRLWDMHTYDRVGSTDLSTATADKNMQAAVCALDAAEGLIVIGGADGALKAWQVFNVDIMHVR
jgi:hypothetical protein